MKTRDEAEVIARKVARVKLEFQRKVAKENQFFNKVHRPFSMADFVTGFLECYDQMTKEQGK